VVCRNLSNTWIVNIAVVELYIANILIYILTRDSTTQVALHLIVVIESNVL